MREGKVVVVVVPAFREARLIGRTLRGVPAFVDRVVVVDDASDDGTTDAARAAADRRVSVVRHATNRGVGAAIVTGYREAARLGADVIAVMAGDAQMHPDDLASVVDPVVRGDAGYAKGDRLHHPDVVRAMPWPRLAASLVLSRATAWATGLPRLADSQCGYTAIDARVLAQLDLDTLWPRYGYPNDLLGRAAAAGVRVVDVVVRPVYADETSGLRARHLARIAWLIGRAWARRRRAEAAGAASSARETGPSTGTACSSRGRAARAAS